VTSRNVTLGNPTLTSELKERLAAGITAETAGAARHWIEGYGGNEREHAEHTSRTRSRRIAGESS
jgi:hypothetical protein